MHEMSFNPEEASESETRVPVAEVTRLPGFGEQ
jgi:hypothetical protein